MAGSSSTTRTGQRWNRWTHGLIAVTALLVIAFAVLASIGFQHVQDLTVAKDDTSWIISQISYEHQRLLLAAETGGSPTELRMRGDIFLSRVNLLRNAPMFDELRELAPKENLDTLLASAHATDKLIDNAATGDGHQAMLARLRADSGNIRQEIAELSRLNYSILVSTLAGHANDILRYIIAFSSLLLVVIGLSFSGALISRRNLQLEAQRNRANDASRLKSQFLANMSHEIRTPLNGIHGTLQTMDLDSLSQSNKESIEIIGRSSESLLNIVNDILDLSKIEAGETTTSPTLFNIRTFVADILSRNAALLNNKDIDLLVSFDESLPQEMFSDRQKLEQVLNNLLSNAAKFTEKGTITLEVRRAHNPITGVHTMESILFAVVDTGIGISSEEQSRLFAAFTQVDNSLSRKNKGTGLGLHISRKLIEILGGELTLASKPGLGTTITSVIPSAISSESRLTETSDTAGTDGGPEVVLLGAYATVFRAALSLAQQDIRTKTINSVEEAKSFLTGTPQSWQAVVADRRFGGDAITWISQLVAVDNFNKDLPIIIVNGLKKLPPLSTHLSVFEIDGRFNRSSLLETLRKAAPSLGTHPPDAQTHGLEPVDASVKLVEEARILVVDDNSVNRRVLVRLLSNAGVKTVGPVSGAEEAMKRLEQTCFDIILMDLQMPEIDGYTAARLIREKGHISVKFIACSAHAFESDIKRSMDEGFNGHISKPVEAAELMALIKDAILSSRSSQRNLH